MPSIDEAMARSLQGSAWEVVKDKFVRTIVADLSRRDMLADAAQTTDEVAQKSEDFATAFSSWDNCMNVAWCNATKHLDDPYAPQSQHHGYRSEPPMNPSAPQYGVTKPMRSEPPQYAEFETSKGRDDDALPEMPSWEGASSKKVEVHTEAVELDTLPSKPPHSQQSNMMGGVSPNNLTPYSQAQSNSSGYLGANQAPDVYSPIDQQGYGYQAPGMNPMYSSAAAVAPMPHERRSPALNTNGYSNQGYGHDQGFEQTQGYGQMQGYGQQGYGQATSPNDYAATYSGYRGTPPPRPASFAKRASMHQDEFGTYGQLPPRRSPAIPEDYGYGSPVRQSPGPQNDFGYAQPPRQSPAPMNDYRTPPPGPDTSYGAHPAQQRQHMPESHSPQEPYPGFKPYQP
ncbi:hypothetical protein FPRO05_05551 [Fusarium proliferatum]|uniref:Uncharacterized protein n=1 Tax=Gibberella intermedia TaxID=948311 RepID=A0A365MRB0_GIBIN|nr:hypothetical protein FPRO05_05551 [Fusarium proliferatum]